ncbi:hypothetical protein [Caulobacter endophyticus]|uniref:hypothetical protein n=1 Tax=Caulobacter endophyticus TaxID=2172652 RepID=UPI00240EC073|nr:hypothetical protein [Caulobacter endophyticus]MDG2527892.1 hypothetical protein [Caulobacter endophyticus]
MSASDQTCDCCGGAPHPGDALSPAPRQAALAYRVLDHGRARRTMIQDLPRQAALAGLTTRAPSDPAIALLDAWAVGLDVLTFYQDRIANEGFLRTATERRSLLELARTIAYELAPGVAAGTFLAIACDEVPGSPATVAIPAGTKVQSVPAGDELPQTFEVTAPLVALPQFSDMRVETARFHAPAAGDTKLWLDGLATRLKPGDPIVLIGNERRNSATSTVWQLRKVAAMTLVSADVENRVDAHTLIQLEAPLGADAAIPKQSPRAFALRQRTNLFGFNAPHWDTLPQFMRTAELRPELSAAALFNSGQSAQYAVDVQPLMMNSGTNTGIAAAMQGIALNDLNLGVSLDLIAESPLIKGLYADRKSSWAEATFPSDRDYLDLDQVHDGFVGGGWVAVRNATTTRLYGVTSAVEVGVTDFTLAQRVTRLTISGPELTPFSPRNATVFGISEPLAWGRRPITTSVQGDTVVLMTARPELTPGRLVAVTGQDAVTGEPVARVLEVAAVSAVTAGGSAQMQDVAVVTTQVRFTTEIDRPLVARTVRLNANVVRATHGESQDHVIGSGDGAAAFQAFRLPQKGLTYVSAATPSGRRTTLEIRVNGVLWSELDDLLGAGANDRVYVTRRADDGSVSVQFGDGITGARLPTGRGNVRARYRIGSGRAGLLAAGQLSQPLTRPLGLKAVTNPMPTTGAKDPETLADAQVNAPLTVRTLGRIVSLADIEDFARGFAGLGKAHVDIIWNGFERVVQLTVAGADGAVLTPLDPLHLNLLAAMDLVRHADRPIRVDGHQERRFSLRARLKIDKAHIAADVLTAAKTALIAAFAFDRRAFAQPVSASEVLAVLHGVDGVTAVFLERLQRTDDPTTAFSSILAAKPARFEAGVFRKAELLLIDAAGVDLTEAST